jgi:hypothetical protein
VACAVVLALAGCSSGTDGNAATTAAEATDGGGAIALPTFGLDSDSAVAGDLAGTDASPTATAAGTPIGSIRVINAYQADGKPGGPMDLYDHAQPPADLAPLVANLAYGAVSPYVSPRGWGTGSTTSNLYLFPAGAKEGAGAYTGSNIDNSGYESDEKLTVVIIPSSMGASSFGSVEIADADSSDGRSPRTTAPASDATLTIVQADTNLDAAADYQLLIDGACESMYTPDGAWAVPAGHHTLGIIGLPHDKPLTDPQCKAQAATPTATAEFDATAGGRVDAVVLGSTPTDLSLVVAPVS